MSTLWEQIGALARLAPTPHNTQPFRIVPRNDREALLTAVPSRFLPREDHGNLYVSASFGIFLEALEMAARFVEREITIEVRDDVDVASIHAQPSPVPLARVTLGAARPFAPDADARGIRVRDDLRKQLEVRRTSRLPYHDRLVAPDAVAALAQVAAAGRHRFIPYDDPAVVGPLLELNAQAIIDNLQFDDEREEIRGWYRYGPTPESGDGLWQAPMNQPAWELRSAFIMPRAFSLPVFKQFAVRRYLRTQAGTRHIALLCGEYGSWPSLVRAGRMLMKLWLAMAAADVYMQPMGSMLTNPVYVKEIARRFKVDDCWLVFRFGYSDPPVRAPRLSTIVEAPHE